MKGKEKRGILEENSRSRFIVNIAYYLIIAGVIYLIYKYLLVEILPFIAALAVGFLAQKPARKFSKKFNADSRTIAAISALLIYLALGAAVVLIIVYVFSSIPSVTGSISSLITLAADKITAFSRRFSSITEALPEQLKGVVNNLPKSVAEKSGAVLTSFASSAVSFAAKSVPSFLFGLIIAVMASVYFARDFGAVKQFFLSVIPERHHNGIIKIKNILIKNVFKMLKGYGTLCLITFAELSLGFLIIGINNPLFYAAVISLIDALPILGVGIVLVPWAVIAIIAGNVRLGIMLAVLYLIVAVMRNILEPKILSARLGIPPLLSLLIIFLGLKLFGFFGMLIAFISLVIFIDYYREDIG